MNSNAWLLQSSERVLSTFRRDHWLWQSWKQVLFSYLHKAVLLAAAWAAFATLHWLGNQKTTFDQQVETRWQMDSTVRDQVLAYCGEEDRGVKLGYATQQEAIAAVQERAEACEWKRFLFRIKPVKQKIALLVRKSELAEEDSKLLSSYYGRIEKEEAYARSRAAVTRKQVAARLLNGGLTEEDPKPREGKALDKQIFPTLDEHSGSHVIYQLLWYGSLIFGLAAATLLGVSFLASLPITDGEGYWTQRLGQIFDRIPGTAGRTLAAPLVAATLGVGTLTGAMAETQAGGQAQTTVDQRAYDTTSTTFDQRTFDRSRTLIDQSTGDTNYEGDRIYFPSWPPPWEELTDPLGKISTNSQTIAEKTTTLSENSEEIERQIGEIVLAAQTADGRLAKLENTVNGLHSTSGHMLACLHDLQPVIEKVEDVKQRVDWHSEDTRFFEGGVNTREIQQEGTSKASLSQSAEVDRRNAFKRNVLWTVYKVGPAAPGIMKEYLEGDPYQEKFVNAVIAMQSEPPKSSRNFKKLLLRSLKHQGLENPEANDLVKKHFLSLRKVSTLPRR